MRKSFKLENLDCANCAAKMEAGISELPGVSKATISFMTSKLMIDADTDDAEAFAAIVDAAQQVCASYEKDCIIKRYPPPGGKGAALALRRTPDRPTCKSSLWPGGNARRAVPQRTEMSGGHFRRARTV